MAAGQPEIITLKTTVQPGDENIVSERVRQNGVIMDVLIHFPPGANALVDVAVRVENEQLVPIEGFIALDDATVPFKASRRIRSGQEVSAIVRNADSVNPHTITVIVTNAPEEFIRGG